MSAPSQEAINNAMLAAVWATVDADRDFRNSLDENEMIVEPDFSPNHTQIRKMFNHPGWHWIVGDAKRLQEFNDLADELGELDAFYKMVKDEEPTSPQQVEALLNLEEV